MIAFGVGVRHGGKRPRV